MITTGKTLCRSYRNLKLIFEKNVDDYKVQWPNGESDQCTDQIRYTERDTNSISAQS